MSFDFRKAILSIFAAALLLGSGLAAFAQDEKFESVYGNFSIDLPKVTTVSKGFRDDDSKVKTAGMIYAWDTGRIVYTVRYSTVSGISKKIATAAERLALEDKAVADTITQYKGETLSQREFVVAGVKGTEIVARVGAGKMTVRNVVIKGHAYSIQAIARSSTDEAEAVRRLDSFRVTDGRATLAKQIEAATSKPFAKTDSKRWPSDAKSENLRGPVKSVAEMKEDLTGELSQQGAMFASQNKYNRRGLKLARAVFTQNGRLQSIYVFGFQNKARSAQLTGLIGAKKDPSIRTIRQRFDRLGRMTEDSAYEASGENIYKRRNIHSASRTVSTTVSGSITVKTTDDLNAKGDPIRSTIEISSSAEGPGKTRFKYLRYDRFGNWTKRIVYGAEERDGKISWEANALETRIIAYF